MNYFNAIKDILIVLGVGFTLWFVMHAEHNADEIKSIKATLEQSQKWQKEQTDAGAIANTAITALNGRFDKLDQRGPVIVRIPVPQAGTSASSAGSPHPDTGGSTSSTCGDVRPVDIRPVLESPERKLATAMIECKQLLDSWPR